MPGATFTRASAGWYFNSAGILTTSTNNVARFDYDPATLTPLGYLAEMQSTNNVLNSGDVSNASWTKNNITVTGNANVAPDGTTTAATLTEDSATTAKYVGTSSMSWTSGNITGMSVFVKNLSGSRWLQLGPTGGDAAVNFQPSTGTIGTVGARGASAVARQLANGWWRLSVLYTSNFTGSTDWRFYMVSASNSSAGASYTGDGTSGFALWGAQYETAGVGVTSYIPTAGSTVTRSQDILTLPLTSLPGWRPTQGGVLVAAYRLHTLAPSTPGNNQAVFKLDDGTPNNGVFAEGQYAGTGVQRHFVASGGVTQADLNNGPAVQAVFVRRKLAIGWGIPRAVSAYDGNFVSGVNTVTALPVGLTELAIGGNSSQQLNGTIESIAYYAGARSDAFVQQVSR